MADTEANPYLAELVSDNRIEQNHRRIKRLARLILGFKSEARAAIILTGIEMIHMIRKRQAR